MDHIKNLRCVYSFPGCDARASVQSYRDDPAAIVVTLQRRRKKRSAAVVEHPTYRITILDRVTCVTWLAATGEFTCFCNSVE
jgi:hypothetical protein